MTTRRTALAAVTVLLSCLCSADDAGMTAATEAFAVPVQDASAYSQPGRTLSERQREAFLRGRAGFNRPWVVFAVSTGDWGVGPTFVTDRCSACHDKGGRGKVPDSPHEQLSSMVVRVSLPGAGVNGAPTPLDHYGEQLQNRALQGQSPALQFAYAPVPAEADLYLAWQEHEVTLADGTKVSLRSPKLSIEEPAFGELPAGTLTSPRLAPSVFGLGLLEAVPAADLLAIAARQRELGFNGRANRVWDAINNAMAMGRFGWKASQPGLRQQIAAAALHDMGVTTSLFSRQNCPPVQTLCRGEVPGNDPELSDAAWDDFEILMLGSAVPARRALDSALAQRGEHLFGQLQCAVCHVPTLRTADYFPRMPELSRQTLHPYTDMLLHDMGEGLADHRPDFAAGGRDWRTPPLWGLGLSRTVNGSRVLLHDGRARSITEAILWHGGEAQGARDGFAALTKEDREVLEAFINSL